MAPHYTYHKVDPDKGRRTESYIHYYVCAPQIKASQEEKHNNRVLARIVESWVLDSIHEVLESPGVIQRAIDKSRAEYEQDAEPNREALTLMRAALQENQTKIDQVLEAVTNGRATNALFAMLNERAASLRFEREKLQSEQRRLLQVLAPPANAFDLEVFRSTLSSFSALAQAAEPEELQRLVRLLVSRIDWAPDSASRIQFYYLPRRARGEDWFATNVQSDTPKGRTEDHSIIGSDFF
jgi:hypothetical protein